MPWTFLRASTTRLSGLTLLYADGDARCDVKVGTTVYSGGTIVRTMFPLGGVTTTATSR